MTNPDIDSYAAQSLDELVGYLAVNGWTADDICARVRQTFFLMEQTEELGTSGEKLITERVEFPAGDDPPLAEAAFTLTYPGGNPKIPGYEYVELIYNADGTEIATAPMSVEEFKRLTKMFLRFDEQLVKAGVRCD